MHDLDRSQPESYLRSGEQEWEFDEQEWEFDEYEWEFDEFEGSHPLDQPEWETNRYSAGDELEMTARLLDVTDEAELEEFLGDLVSKAAKAAGRAISSPTGQALVGVLRDTAKQVVPRVGGVLARQVVPGRKGEAFGRAAGRRVVNWLGLELEGLSPEDAEFESARAFVRFAKDAGRMAASGRVAGPPPMAAKRAAVRAAKRHSPDLVRVILRSPSPGATTKSTAGPTPTSHTPSSGRWVRRGRRLIVLGL